MSHQIMTPERIAEFRDAIANHPHFGIGGDALSKILDALEAAQQEIADLAKMTDERNAWRSGEQERAHEAGMRGRGHAGGNAIWCPQCSNM